MNSKTKNILSWIVAGLLAFAFFGAGLTKVVGLEMQMKNLASWGYPLWLRFPIGLSEMAMAIALLLPRFRRITSYGIFPWMLIAVYTHLQATPPQYEGIGAPIFFAVLAAVILILSKTQAEIK
jgi:uncharacterized membrane protein YphA (DoxX/SURF4 family)